MPKAMLLNPFNPKQKTGLEAEARALAWLKKQGLRLVAQNVHCRVGELDIIMFDKQHLVFIEVRQRKPNRFGDAVSSITPAKQKKIMKAATYYMTYHRIYDKYPVRFDVVCFDDSQSNPTWIKNAFGE